MSRKVKIGFLIGLLVTLLSVVVWAINPQFAFELDGNTKTDNGPGPDWNLLNGDCTVPGGGSGSPDGTSTRTCVASENPPKIFTGGGSKDPSDISAWKWKQADTVPDKDTINHAYAATILNANNSGHKVVYVGGDRFAVNGDANIGAWFFQQEVSPTGTGPGGGSPFKGVHVDGDVFLVSAFVNGGGTAQLAAYIWNAPGGAIAGGCAHTDIVKTPVVGQCAADNLEFLGFSDTYAITNSNVLPAADVSWSYDAKFGGSTSDPVPAGGFFEGGADLSALFANTGLGDVPCFSSVLLETRSSQEASAVLKDFVAGSFPECKIEVTKNCDCTSVAGNTGVYTYGFSGAVHNSGGGTVYNVLVTDDAGTPSDLTDDRHYACGSLAPNGTAGGGDTKQWPSAACVETAAQSASFNSTSKPATNVAYASATTAPATDSTKINATPYSKVCSTTAAACTVLPGIDVTKICSTDLAIQSGLVAIKVTYSGTVANSAQEALVNVKVSEDDNNDGSVDVSNLTLAGCTSGDGTAGNLCRLNIGVTATFGPLSYFPNTMTVLGAAQGRASFTDKVSGTGNGLIDNQAVSDNATATCVACPAGQCPAN